MDCYRLEKKGPERVKQFIKNRLLSRSNFLRSHTRQQYSNVIEKRETKEGNVSSQCVQISIPEWKLYQSISKYLFRNYLIKLSNSKVSEINLNPIFV